MLFENSSKWLCSIFIASWIEPRKHPCVATEATNIPAENAHNSRRVQTLNFFQYASVPQAAWKYSGQIQDHQQQLWVCGVCNKSSSRLPSNCSAIWYSLSSNQLIQLWKQLILKICLSCHWDLPPFIIGGGIVHRCFYNPEFHHHPCIHPDWYHLLVRLTLHRHPHQLFPLRRLNIPLLHFQILLPTPDFPASLLLIRMLQTGYRNLQQFHELNLLWRKFWRSFWCNPCPKRTHKQSQLLGVKNGTK